MATNKTEFQRFLNERPSSVPILALLAVRYALNPRGKSTFGFWLRVKHRRTFDRAYNSYWLKHPKLHGVIYADCDDDPPLL